jgi:hypothetical protein
MRKFLLTLAFVGFALALAVPAGAATTRYAAIGSPNGAQSQEFADAALVLHEFPAASITASDIASAHAYDLTEGTVTTPQSAMSYLIFTGFDGYKAQAFNTIYTQTESAKLLQAANSGGVYVIVIRTEAQGVNQQTTNAVGAIDIVHATTKLVTSINAKGTYTMTWAVFTARYNPIASDQFYGVTWNAS